MKRISLSFALILAACGPGSLDSLCEEAATTQCERCFTCDVDPSALCSLPADTSQEQCVEVLARTCGDQSATVEEPKQSLRACTDSIDSLTCDLLIASHAQGGPSSVPACDYFL